ncbi:MAG: hypothetical protein V1794_09885 [Candidatus Glassbacteria bacterium]
MSGKFLYLTLTVALLAGSCSSFHYSFNRERNSIGTLGSPENLSHTGRNKYPPYQGEVRVFRSKDELKGLKYESLGLIQSSRASAAAKSDVEMLDDLRTQAADMGANAILITGQDKSGDEVYRVKAQALRLLD